MSKKKLQVEGITNELEGASLFFSKSPTALQPQIVSKDDQEANQKALAPELVEQIVSKHTVVLDNQSDNQDNEQKHIKSIKHASKQASTLSNQPYDPVEAIRKTVKQLGKEVLFIRVTPEEKHELTSIVYSFREIYLGDGRKTSENEVGRVALSFLMQDYREHGNNSILARVLEALNA